MEAEELEIALDELELRLERLRALYEQYFLGIERIEPSVARKDVDRRIFALRREKIRNTGKRYKLQMVIQRYNTFQQYWGRICREIENGTYRRHLLRAERTVGPTELLTTAARRRFGKDRLARSEPPAEPELTPQAAPEPADPLPFGAMNHAVPPAPEAPPAPELAQPRAPGAAAVVPSSVRPAPLPRLSPQAPPKPPPRQPRHTPPMPFPMPPPEGAPVPPSPARSTAVPPAPRASLRPRPPLESLELDMDFMGDWDPAEAASRRGPGREPQQEPAARANLSPPTKPRPAVGNLSSPQPTRGAPPPKPPRPLTVPAPRGPAQQPAQTAPTPVAAARRPAAVTQTAPASAAAGRTVPASAAAGRTTPASAAAGDPTPAPVPPRAQSAARTAPAGDAPDAAMSRSPALPIAPAGGAAARSAIVPAAPASGAIAAPAPAPRVAPSPAVAPAATAAGEPLRRAAAPAAARPETASSGRRAPATAEAREATGPVKPAAPAKPAAPPKTAAASTLNETRLLELHARLSDANRNANQPVVSLDGLTRSLRAAEAKLRAQHGNRRIEFDVVLKDGKPVVKPVVR